MMTRRSLALAFSYGYRKSSISPLVALKYCRMYPVTLRSTDDMHLFQSRQQRRAQSPAAVHWRDAARQADSLPPKRQRKVQESASEDPDLVEDKLAQQRAQRSALDSTSALLEVKPLRLSKEELAKEKEKAKRLKRVRKATNSAMGMVGWRPHSEKELRQKLADKEHEPDAIEEAVNKLQQSGMHSDREYAEIFAQSKWRQSRWAPSKIRWELQSKGLVADDIESALEDVFGDEVRLDLDNLDEDRAEVTSETRFDPRHHLLEGVKCQANLSQGLKPETRKRRLIMWLQRRGHNWESISSLLEHVDLT